MANLDPQNSIAATVSASYDKPIAVSVINKLDKFPFLQELGFNGQLGFLKEKFLGLDDFNDEMTLYSNSNTILKAAWNLIKLRVPLNLDLLKSLYQDPNLGTVGDAFRSLVGFGQVFAVNPDQLTTSTGDSVVSSNLPSI